MFTKYPYCYLFINCKFFRRLHKLPRYRKDYNSQINCIVVGHVLQHLCGMQQSQDQMIQKFRTAASNFLEFIHNLNDYFDLHVCLSIRLSVFRPCVRNLTPLSPVLSQNVTNKSCLVCVMSEKYASWVTLRPQ